MAMEAQHLTVTAGAARRPFPLEQAAVRIAVKRLLKLGLVELARRQWPSDACVPIDDSAAMDDATDRAHERTDFVVVGATEAGENVYLGRGSPTRNGAIPGGTTSGGTEDRLDPTWCL
jgi:hypothetical protein